MLELKLLVEHKLFSSDLEDTFYHQVIDALVSFQFPARSTKYFVDWANGAALGSKKRRGHGYRSDACVLNNIASSRNEEMKRRFYMSRNKTFEMSLESGSEPKA
ncbi:hypothetical protein BGW41_001152 [Actinomortierella wolfii]|nr:hypothetical protein BGW41_001152 [Actinomortierella wolfii]